MIDFVNPGFLWGLIALIIPIIIHLFNFKRYKKVYFSNVRFLKELQSETKKQSQLKRWLLFLSRIFAFLCIILAFAQPFIPIDNTVNLKKLNAVSIYIDNSFSMDNQNDKNSLLEVAKQKAITIAEIYGEIDNFYLQTNDIEVRHQRWLSKEEFISMVAEVESGPNQIELSSLLQIQNQKFNDQINSNRFSYFISDFQKNAFDINLSEPDSLAKYFMLPVQTTINQNLSIDSCWFDTPNVLLGKEVSLYVRLSNYTNDDLFQIPVRLSINGESKALGTIDIEKDKFNDTELKFSHHKSGIMEGVISITDHPLTFDDELFFAYEVINEMNVLEITEGEQTSVFSSLFDSDDIFNFKQVDFLSINYDEISNYQSVIINGLSSIESGLENELLNFVKQGGVLIFFPSIETNINDWNSLNRNFNLPSINSLVGLADDINFDNLNLVHEVFKDVFRNPELLMEEGFGKMNMPTTNKYFAVLNNVDQFADRIINLQNSVPLLVGKSFQNGSVFNFYSPLDNETSNFSSHPLFLPVIYQMTFMSDLSMPLFYKIGQNEPIKIKDLNFRNEDAFSISNDEIDFIPGQRFLNYSYLLFPYDQIKKADIYHLKNNGQMTHSLAYNYKRLESNPDCYSSSELDKILSLSDWPQYYILEGDEKILNQSITDLYKGIQLWKLFVILAIIFLGVEILLIKLRN